MRGSAEGQRQPRTNHTPTSDTCKTKQGRTSREVRPKQTHIIEPSCLVGIPPTEPPLGSAQHCPNQAEHRTGHDRNSGKGHPTRHTADPSCSADPSSEPNPWFGPNKKAKFSSHHRPTWFGPHMVRPTRQLYHTLTLPGVHPPTYK